jgi:hypothetical protein
MAGPNDAHLTLVRESRSTDEQTLSRLLQEAERLKAELTNPALDPRLRAYFEESLMRLCEPIGQIVRDWHMRGGSVLLGERVEGEAHTRTDTSAVDAPTPAPAVAAPPPAGPPVSEDALAALAGRMQGTAPRGAPRFAPLAANLKPVELLDISISRLPEMTGDVKERDTLLDLLDVIDYWERLPGAALIPLLSLFVARLIFFHRARRRLRTGLIFEGLDHLRHVATRCGVRRKVNGLERDEDRKPHGDTWSADAEQYRRDLSRVLNEMRDGKHRVDWRREENPERLMTAIAELADAALAAENGAQPGAVAELLEALRRAIAARNGEGPLIIPRDPRLVRIATPLHDELKGPEFGVLRRAIRDTIEAEEQELAGEDQDTRMAEDWAWLGYTSRKRVAIFGGTPYENRRLQVEAHFRCDAVEWDQAEYRPRALQGLTERVRMGSIDLVILLKGLAGHSADEHLKPACKEKGVPIILINRPSLTQIREGLQRLPQRPRELAPV